MVTLATIPSRVSKIGPVIDSLKAQTRSPIGSTSVFAEFCLREQSPYDVPDWLRHDESVELLVSTKDYGPANKLLGMLDKEPDPNTRIVIIDDDWAYNQDTLEVLERRFDEFGRRAAIGSSGGRLPRHWSQMEARIGPEIEAKPQLRHQLVFIAESPRDAAVDILQYGFGAIVLRGLVRRRHSRSARAAGAAILRRRRAVLGLSREQGHPRICIAGMRLPRPLDHRSTRPLHGDGRATRTYQAAIPKLSAQLNIWALEKLFDPRPPLHVLCFDALASQALRKAYRLAVRPLVMLVTPLEMIIPSPKLDGNIGLRSSNRSACTNTFRAGSVR